MFFTLLSLLCLFSLSIQAKDRKKKLKEYSMIIINLSNEHELELNNPSSVGPDKKTIIRKCSVISNNNQQFIKCSPLPAGSLGKDFSAYESAVEIEIIIIEEVKNLVDLAAFMKNQKNGNLNRYSENSLKDLLPLLKDIELQTPTAKIYDLSKGYFDPREPDSPDIFIILQENPRAIWLKNAKRLQFDWSKVTHRKKSLN